MKEGIRVWPLFFLPLERVVPEGGAEIAGTWIPGGTIVGCQADIVHHDRHVFGEDAAVFKQERWLTKDKDRRLAMESGWLGFGAGKRICIGRHIAEMEMKKVIALLVLTFEV